MGVPHPLFTTSDTKYCHHIWLHDIIHTQTVSFIPNSLLLIGFPLHDLSSFQNDNLSWAFSLSSYHARLRIRLLLTLGPSTGTGFVLIRLEASKGGFTDCGVVVGGGCVVIGRRPPNWKENLHSSSLIHQKQSLISLFSIMWIFLVAYNSDVQ